MKILQWFVIGTVVITSTIGCRTLDRAAAREHVGKTVNSSCAAFRQQCSQKLGNFVFSYRIEKLSENQYRINGSTKPQGARYDSASQLQVMFFLLKNNTVVDVVSANSMGSFAGGLGFQKSFTSSAAPDNIMIARFSGKARG